MSESIKFENAFLLEFTPKQSRLFFLKETIKTNFMDVTFQKSLYIYSKSTPLPQIAHLLSIHIQKRFPALHIIITDSYLSHMDHSICTLTTEENTPYIFIQDEAYYAKNPEEKQILWTSIIKRIQKNLLSIAPT